MQWNIPKILIFTGVVLIIVGLIWMGVSKFIPLGKLPGDIHIKTKNTQFYFPIVTCIVVSIILSIISYIMRFFK